VGGYRADEPRYRSRTQRCLFCHRRSIQSSMYSSTDDRHLSFSFSSLSFTSYLGYLPTYPPIPLSHLSYHRPCTPWSRRCLRKSTSSGPGLASYRYERALRCKSMSFLTNQSWSFGSEKRKLMLLTFLLLFFLGDFSLLSSDPLVYASIPEPGLGLDPVNRSTTLRS
jgi:hypothetical protein